jgi:serine/threonine-protein kinase
LLEPGTRIADRYTVLRQIGLGGMGGVYEIESDALKNRLALKIVRQEFLGNDTIKARFEREARIQADIIHPGVVRVIDLLHHGGQLAIVMELVHGPTLREVLLEGRPSVAQVREILDDVLSALMAAHDADVVHRDLKPDNVFVLTDRGGAVHCKLIDFGIARRMATETQVSRLTRAETFVGTYAYASPEQIQGDGVGARSDLYSLGVVLWEMLAGTHPYAHLDNDFKIQSAVVGDPLPVLPPSIPDDLRALVVELTRKDPAERPQGADEVLATLRRRKTDLVAPTLPEHRTVPEGQALAPAPAPEPGPPPVAATRAQAPPATPATQAAPVSPPASEVAPAAEPQPAPAPAPAPFAVPEPQPTLAPEPSPAPLLPAGLRTAPLDLRLKARMRDELFALLWVLTCVGGLMYPVFALYRGLGLRTVLPVEPRLSPGQKRYGLVLIAVATGQPPSKARIVARNTLDLFSWQAFLAFTFWPVGWPHGLFIPFGLLFLMVVGFEGLLAASSKDGRRLVDHLAGTRVMVTT